MMKVSSPGLLGHGRILRAITRLVVGAAFLNLIVLGIAGLSLQQSRQRHEEMAAAASRNLAVVLDRDISSTIDKIDLALLVVRDEVVRRKASRDAGGDTLDSFIERQGRRLPELHGLRTTDALGNVINGMGLVAGVRANLADRFYFQELAGNPASGVVVSKPVVSRVSGAWEIVVARRIDRPDGSFDGVVYATIALKYFSDSFAAIDVGRHGYVSLRGTDLGLVARYPETAENGQGAAPANVSPAFRAAALSGQSSATFTSAVAGDGLLRTSSFRRLQKYPLLVAVGLGTDDYLASWHGEVVSAGILVAAFASLTALFAALMFQNWKRREEDLQTLGVRERKFRTLLESSPDALLIADEHEVISIVNRNAEVMFGYEQSELVGRSATMLLAERSGKGRSFLRYAGTNLQPEGSERDWWAVTKSGHEFPISISLSPIETEEGPMVAASIRDVAQIRANEERIEFLAHHDPLTELPNRVIARSRFEQAIAQAERSGSKVALLFLDLDRFKEINDSLGHAVGDGLLKAVSQRLRTGARETDTISRHGGDEFLVCLAELADANAAKVAVERLVDSFRPPCLVDGHEIVARCSIGVALYPDDGTDYATLLSKADIAMYRAKGAGRNAYRFFSDPGPVTLPIVRSL